ncbi:rCG34876 [Rattus norvegicus]|uniref:RCG34876 n=1 Tax=Rattus norvegicus TaxID=10116 RepID=A6HFY5_RAT|nr:rCG34876 [Rattus norvegicus]
MGKNWMPGTGLGLLKPKRNQKIKINLRRPEPSGMREEKVHRVGGRNNQKLR